MPQEDEKKRLLKLVTSDTKYTGLDGKVRQITSAPTLHGGVIRDKAGNIRGIYDISRQYQPPIPYHIRDKIEDNIFPLYDNRQLKLFED